MSTNEMRKGIMNNNMNMKNTEYKMNKKNIACKEIKHDMEIYYRAYNLNKELCYVVF